MTKTIRIGCASGFWGDSMMAAPQLVQKGKLDYLVFDYLAEITMSIMARQRAKDPDAGYAHDFVSVTMKQNLKAISEQGIKVISNAGGVNPEACGKALEALIAEQGLELKVAWVAGDDLMARMEEFAGLQEMFSGADFPPADKIMSLNAYLGARPIAEALDKGADIVVTGRGVDSAVTLGACLHEFGWSDSDYDKLAGGSLAGHIIECGAQATGGLFTDWNKVPGWENIGYPIVEVDGEGAFTVTKPEDTGGLVSFGTVAEQMVYEIGDPQAYMLADVVCDFSDVRIEETGKDRVRVSNAKGSAPTPTYKCSLTYRDGYRVGTYLSIGGIDASAKARRTADAVIARARGMLRAMNTADFTEVSVEVIGAEDSYGPHARDIDPRTVILKLAAKHEDKLALSMLLRELVSSGTSMSPGTTGMGGNRARPSPVVRLFSCLIPKTDVPVSINVAGAPSNVEIASGTEFDPSALMRPNGSDDVSWGDTVEVPLIKLAYGRSGDKGDSANIGIIARSEEFLPFIRTALTEDAVADYMAHTGHSGVTRYDLPGINGFNFLLTDALGGGGIASLRNDPQGKGYAQMLLEFPVRVPTSMKAKL